MQFSKFNCCLKYLTANCLLKVWPLLVLICTFFSVPNTYAQSQTARIIKGNALNINGAIVILHSAVVPTASSRCDDGERVWPCGAAATLRLNKLIQDSTITCKPVSHATPISRCQNLEVDIAMQLVKEGWAVVATESSEYLQEETHARTNSLGIWRGGFSPPENWRNYPDLKFNPIADLLCSSCAQRKQ